MSFEVGDPLEAPRPRVDAEQAAKLLEVLYGLDAELTELHGERDRNFRVDAPPHGSFVFKVYHPLDGPEVIDMRSRAIGHVRRVDPELPLPEIVSTREGAAVASMVGQDGRTSIAQLFAFIEGRHASREELDERALYKWGQTVARLDRALRGFFHPAASYLIQWDLRHTEKLRERIECVEEGSRRFVDLVIESFVRQVVPRIPFLHAQVVHNDMSRENVLVDVDGDIVGITDWGDATHTASVFDLAIAIAEVLHGRPDSIAMAEPIIAGYSATVPLEQEEAGLLGYMVAARLACEVVLDSWRTSDLAHETVVPVGTLEFLEQIETAGLPETVRRLQRFARRSSAAGGVVPYPPRPTAELLTARRQVLGPLKLAYDDPLHLVRGDGVHLFDTDGRRYLDAYNNVPVVGHCNPDVWAAMAAQAKLLVTNTRYLHEANVELAERLVESAPPGLDRVLFVNSGSEANDLAWRIARFTTGQRGAIVTRFAYHGLTESTTDLSPEVWLDGYRPDYVGLVDPPGTAGEDDVRTVVERLAAAGRSPAAVFVDPALTSDGILGPADDWLLAVVTSVRGLGGLFVADEVQVGFGRSGEHLWGTSSSQVEPDLMTLGKPMGNGFPVAALLGRAELVDPFIEETGYFSTFGGNTLACAVALAVLGMIEDQHLVEHAASVGAHLRGRLAGVSARHDAAGALRGWGLLLGLEIVGADGRASPTRAKLVVNRLKELGVLVGTTGPSGNVLKIRPPLVFEKRDAEELADQLDVALSGLRVD